MRYTLHKICGQTSRHRQPSPPRHAGPLAWHPLASLPPGQGFAAFPLAMSATTVASLPPAATCSTATSSRFLLNLVSVPKRRRLSLRLHRSLVVPASAASSPSVPSSPPEPGSGIGDALGGVAIFSAATGEPVLIRDLWDQNEVEMLTLFSDLL